MMEGLVPWIISSVIIVGVMIILRKPLSTLFGLGLRSCGALALLTILNPIGGAIGISLGVNITNAFVMAVLGVPGFGLLLMLQWVLR